MKKIWLISLCVLLVIASVIGWNIPLRIAIGTNAAIILIDVIIRIWRMKNGREKKKN